MCDVCVRVCLWVLGTDVCVCAESVHAWVRGCALACWCAHISQNSSETEFHVLVYVILSSDKNDRYLNAKP